jgi:hypothetical protein
MKRTWAGLCALLMAAALAGCGGKKTVFDGRSAQMSIKAYMESVGKTRALLLSDDDDDQEAGMEIVRNSLAAARDEGDLFFPLQLLADFVIGAGAEDLDELDEDLQEEALDLIVAEVENSKRSLGQREYAIEQLGRVASAERLNDSDWAETAVEALAEQADGKDPILARAALIALGHVTVKTGEFLDAAQDAADAIAERMDDSDAEMRRFAIHAAILALGRAKESTEPVEDLWDALEDAAGDVESPAHQADLRARLTALIARQQAGVFSDELDALRAILATYKAERVAAKDSYADSISDLKSEEDEDDIDEYLARIEQDVRDKKVLPNGAIAALAPIAANVKAPAHKVRAVTDSMFAITVASRSAGTYRITAKAFADLVKYYRSSALAEIPAVQLGRLLSATDRADLAGPAMQEARALALTNLPLWIQRRLVTVLYVQAGDAVDPAVRRDAFTQLAQVGGGSPSWGLRLDVLARMTTLSRLASQADVREAAAKWN